VLKLYAVLGLLLFSAVPVLSAVPPVSAAKPPLCGMTITASLTLAGDVGPCPAVGIIVGAAGITLNCNGFTITGKGTNRGIDVIGGGDLVENCVATSFEYGVFVTSTASHSIVSQNTATGNQYGFYVQGSVRLVGGYSTYTGNTAESNSNAGFYIYHSSYNTFTGNIAKNNGADGFALFHGATHNQLISNSADDNKGYGFQNARPNGHGFSGNECSGNLGGGSSPTGLCAPQA